MSFRIRVPRVHALPGICLSTAMLVALALCACGPQARAHPLYTTSAARCPLRLRSRIHMPRATTAAAVPRAPLLATHECCPSTDALSPFAARAIAGMCQQDTSNIPATPHAISTIMPGILGIFLLIFPWLLRV